jgi:hypothetical protein
MDTQPVGRSRIERTHETGVSGSDPATKMAPASTGRGLPRVTITPQSRYRRLEILVSSLQSLVSMMQLSLEPGFAEPLDGCVANRVGDESRNPAHQ